MGGKKTGVKDSVVNKLFGYPSIPVIATAASNFKSLGDVKWGLGMTVSVTVQHLNLNLGLTNLSVTEISLNTS